MKLVPYDRSWPEEFLRLAHEIRRALGTGAEAVHHVGSTAVPSLPAKPVIDIVLTVSDSSNEDTYIGPLRRLGYELTIREPDWFEHRLLQRADPAANLHTFSAGCPEVERMLVFRDWLRQHESDRELYAATKLSLAESSWESVQDYADAKSPVVEEILARARRD